MPALTSDSLTAWWKSKSDGAAPSAAHAALVLGVMTSPGAKQNRRNLRELSHMEPGARGARVVFVLGDVGCARNGTSREAAHHGDIVYVQSNDCSTYHRGPKVFAWYQYAVRRWPRAQWIGKTEDDGVTRLSSLLRDLSALDPREPWYYGIMQLTASCTFRETCPDQAGGSDWRGCCGGCFAGSLQPYPTERGSCHGRASCQLPRCRVVGADGVRARPGTPQCAEIATAPFAVGPVEVRPSARQAVLLRSPPPPRYALLARLLSAGALAAAGAAGGGLRPRAALHGGALAARRAAAGRLRLDGRRAGVHAHHVLRCAPRRAPASGPAGTGVVDETAAHCRGAHVPGPPVVAQRVCGSPTPRGSG